MFDARSLLEQLLRNGGQPQQAGATPQGGGLGDILGQLGQAMGQPGGAGRSGAGGGGGGLADILGRLGEAMGQPGASPAPGRGGDPGSGSLRNIMPDDIRGGSSPQQSQPADGAGAAGAGGGLGDILGRIQDALGQQAGGKPGAQGAGGGGLMDVLGQILGQATQGVREGAGKIDEATGASGHMRDAVGKATGKSPDEILAQLRDLIQNNQLGAGAVLGGLGSILLGTQSGRSLTVGAAKLGALALIGGLAYKALQNYQQGRPVAGGQANQLTTAPDGSGFEPTAVTHEAAQLYIRGMIAAAAADGRIDEREQQKILGGLKQAGLDAEAEQFLANELNNPATVDDLVRSVHSEAEAVQLYTAARVAIDLDNAEEHEFLVALAQGLGIDDKLASHIDAQARAA